MKSLRTAESQAKYQKLISEGHLTKDCQLCLETSIIEFEHWRIIPNDFPYDRILDVHDMIIPKEHITELDLSDKAKAELILLKTTYLNEHYHYIMESVPKNKSIPRHFHLHLVVPRYD